MRFIRSQLIRVRWLRRRSALYQCRVAWVRKADKFDFYAMDCYRLIGDNNLAEMHARELIRKTTTPDGTSHSPMRNTEARLTLGVVAARQGDLEQALAHGHEALAINRRSRPSCSWSAANSTTSSSIASPESPTSSSSTTSWSSSTTHEVA